MRPFLRLVAGTLGAGVLVATGTATASAATTADTPSSASKGAATDGPATPPAAPSDTPSATQTYLLPGVAAPTPDPAVSAVPQVLAAANLPFGALADLTGEGHAQPGPNGAQAGPGSAES